MADNPVTAFWIVPPGKFPLSHSFGVTAFSVEDAFQIIEEAGHELPEDRSSLRVTEGVRVSDLDQKHVVPNIGPMVVRGLWYPFTKIGV